MKDTLNHSLDRLGLDYVDISRLTITTAHGGQWKNYMKKVKPAVNMIECNAFFQREDEFKYMQVQGLLEKALEYQV